MSLLGSIEECRSRLYSTTTTNSIICLSDSKDVRSQSKPIIERDSVEDLCESLVGCVVSRCRNSTSEVTERPYLVDLSISSGQQQLVKIRKRNLRRGTAKPLLRRNRLKIVHWQSTRYIHRAKLNHVQFHSMATNKPVEEKAAAPSTETLLSVTRLKSQQTSCSQQLLMYQDDDTNINELAAYFDNFVYIPKKMSLMAEMMYT